MMIAFQNKVGEQSASIIVGLPAHSKQDAFDSQVSHRLVTVAAILSRLYLFSTGCGEPPDPVEGFEKRRNAGNDATFRAAGVRVGVAVCSHPKYSAGQLATPPERSLTGVQSPRCASGVSRGNVPDRLAIARRVEDHVIAFVAG